MKNSLICLFLLSGHGLRFRTKAEKQRAEKENETADSCVTEKERSSSSSSSPLPPGGLSAELQDHSTTQKPLWACLNLFINHSPAKMHSRLLWTLYLRNIRLVWLFRVWIVAIWGWWVFRWRMVWVWKRSQRPVWTHSCPNNNCSPGRD